MKYLSPRAGASLERDVRLIVVVTKVVASNAEPSTTKLTGATWSQFAKQHAEAEERLQSEVLAWCVGAG